MTSQENLEHVYLPDSWVLEVGTTASTVCFVLEAVLQPHHPAYYSPPNPGEQHAYARLRWCLSGDVRWINGPNLDHPAQDATGDFDFGHIDSWFKDGRFDCLEGDWGSVRVGNAKQSVEYL